MNLHVSNTYSLSIVAPQPQPELGLASLTVEERGLYMKIVNRLMDIYRTRYHNPDLPSCSGNIKQICAIIFRQSKSWKVVENMFKTLSLNPTVKSDGDVSNWVQSWMSRIENMRELQTNIRNLADQMNAINSGTANLDKENRTTTVRGKQISTNQQLAEIERKINKNRFEISNNLEEGKNSIKHLEATNSSLNANEQKIMVICNEVIEFMQKFWPHLSVFLNLPEISLDEETMSTQVRTLKNPDSLTGENLRNVLNSSTIYISIIKEDEYHASPMDFNKVYCPVESGSIIHTKKVAQIQEQHYTPAEEKSPLAKSRQSSRRVVTDEITFCTVNTSPRSEKSAEDLVLIKIRQIVTMALDTVNKKLQPELPAEPGDHFIHRISCYLTGQGV